MSDENRGPSAGAASGARFLSIRDIQTRWACSRRYVYGVIAEMLTQGYLRRIWLGRHQRVALESVERWEAIHAEPEKDTVRSTVAKLRAAHDRAPPPPKVQRQPTAAELRAMLRKAL